MQVQVLSGVPNNAGIAQLVEQLPCKHQVTSSSPVAGTKIMEVRAVEGGWLAWKAKRGSVPTMGIVLPRLRHKIMIDIP